jgi:hypothetical protein
LGPRFEPWCEPQTGETVRARKEAVSAGIFDGIVRFIRGGLFQGEGDMFINEVPPDDYRSIRRAILRPEDMPGA